MTTLIILQLIALGLLLWTCWKIWNGPDRGWTIPALLLFPLAMAPLFRNWGHPRFDLKVPFVATVLAVLLAGFWARKMLEEVEVEYIVPTNTIDYVEMDEVDRSVLRYQVANDLKRQRGRVELDPIPATIDVPARFFYLDLEQARKLANAYGLEPEDGTLGLLLHDSVDLADDELSPWTVSLSFFDHERISWGDPASWDLELLEGMALRHLDQLGLTYEDPWEFIEFAVQPEVNDVDKSVVWAERTRYLDGEALYVDCHGLQAGRRGHFFVSVTDMPLEQEELCFRTVRLMVSRLRFLPGHTWGDAHWFEPRTRLELFDVITGRAALEGWGGNEP